MTRLEKAVARIYFDSGLRHNHRVEARGETYVAFITLKYFHLTFDVTPGRPGAITAKKPASPGR